MTGILILALAGFAPWVAIKMAHFAGVHLEGMHMMAGHATAGATAVQSMARPVGAAVMPGGMAGAAAAAWRRRARSPGRRRHPPTRRAVRNRLSAVGKPAPSNVGAEAASSGATTPSANGSGPSSNGSPTNPTAAAASAPNDRQPRSTPGADAPSSAPP